MTLTKILRHSFVATLGAGAALTLLATPAAALTITNGRLVSAWDDPQLAAGVEFGIPFPESTYGLNRVEIKTKLNTRKMVNEIIGRVLYDTLKTYDSHFNLLTSNTTRTEDLYPNFYHPADPYVYHPGFTMGDDSNSGSLPI